jgi:hypothetical protein
MNVQLLNYRKPDEFRWRQPRLRVQADHTCALLFDRFEDTLPVYLTAHELDNLAEEWLAWRKEQRLFHHDDYESATIEARIEAARGN